MTSVMGAPTKYTEAIQSEAEDYLLTWSDTDSIPSRVGLCCRIGISKQTSFNWEHHPDFLATLQAIDTLQEMTAVNKGITGVFNSTITKLVLANHGYSDKQVLDHSSSDGSFAPTRIELVAPSNDNG